MNTGTALYDYEATDSDQLSLSSGQRVRVLEHLEGGWSYGEVLGSGEHGHFPTEYVQLDEVVLVHRISQRGNTVGAGEGRYMWQFRPNV